MEMNFEFNEYGVCLNPTVIIQVQDKQNKLELKIATRNNMWGFAWTIKANNYGMTGPVSIPILSKEELKKSPYSRMLYGTKQLAIDTAIKWFKQYLINCNEDLSWHKKQLDVYNNQNIQLKLF